MEDEVLAVVCKVIAVSLSKAAVSISGAFPNSSSTPVGQEPSSSLHGKNNRLFGIANCKHTTLPHPVVDNHLIVRSPVLERLITATNFQ